MVCGPHLYMLSGISAGYTGGGLSQNSYVSNGGKDLYNKDSMYNFAQNDLPVYEKNTISDTLTYEMSDTQQNYVTNPNEEENSMYDLNRTSDSIEAQVNESFPQFVGKRKDEETHEVHPDFDMAINGDNVDDVEYQTNAIEDIREISQYLPAGYLGNVVYDMQDQQDIGQDDDLKQQDQNFARSKHNLANLIKDELSGFDQHELSHEQHEHHQGQYEGVHLLYN
jgi:hypothetical protein